MATPKKEDIAGSPIYRLIARNSLVELHGKLMESLSTFFANRPGKHTLVVAGQGPEVVPFSRNLDVVERMIGPGNIAMFDYNPDIIAGSIDALVHPRFDADETIPPGKGEGIKERGYKLVDVDPNEIVNLRNLGQRVVLVRQGDLSAPFKFADASVSAFEATLAIHHVTAYRQGLDHVVSEVHRILEPGGLFHWGTGNVTMRYQEEKIHTVANALKQFFNADVAVEDYRDHSSGSEKVVARAFYSKSEEYARVPLVDEATYIQNLSDYTILVSISKSGGIHIDLRSRNQDDFRSQLMLDGFKQVYYAGEGKLLLPIIDQGMQKDRDSFLESVRHYYRGIMSVNNRVFSDKPDIAAQVSAVDNKEFGDASRGVFEYYTAPEMIREILQANGFKDVTYHSDSNDVWCNITAIKE